MEIGTWCNSGNADNNIYWRRSCSSKQYDRFVSHEMALRRSHKAPIWRLLWRKIKKEKKRMFSSCSSTTSMRYTYDPYTYAQNFDEGLMWDDGDHDLAARSFSARFAVPSRIFEKNDLMVL